MVIEISNKTTIVDSTGSRISSGGKFLGCSGYPKGKNTAEVPAKLVEELGLNGNGEIPSTSKKPGPNPIEDADE